MPKQYENTPLEHIAGYVGGRPEVKDGPKGEWVNFSVGVTRGYGEDAQTQWYGVGVNDQQVQDFVMSKVRKGTPVVLEGRSYKSERGGVEYDNFNAYRVGLVDWFVKGSGSRQTREDEDL
jgi:hypothetical protein